MGLRRGWYIAFVWLVLAASISTASVQGELKVWHKVTVVVDGPQTAEQATPNPFTDYRLNVTFTGPQGQNYIVPGYYAADGNAADTGADCGNQWHAHLAPDAAGRWAWRVSFRAGENIAVSDDPAAGRPVEGPEGRTGTFTVAPTDKTGRDFRGRGMLRYVRKHHLQFAGTKAYFLKCGADAPENLLAYADFDGNFKTDGIKDDLVKTWQPHIRDWRPGDPTWRDGKGKGLIGALNYLASKGLNAFSFLPMNIEGDDRNVFMYTDYNERLRLDVSRLAQWEIVFEHADTLGLHLHFKTQETENELLLDGGNLGLQRKLYYRELIARFAHHLALNWNLGEEINDATTAQKKAWAAYFWEHDPYRHPIVIHNGANHHDLLGDPPAGSHLTGFSLQTGSPEFVNVHQRTLDYIKRSAAAGRPWVVACDEPGDATHSLVPDTDTPEHDPGRNNARQNALWGAVMAGGAGVEWYFGYQHDHSDLTCQDFRSRDAFWDQCRYMLAFFADNEIPFWEMVNDNALLTGAEGCCLKKDGQLYVVFLKTAVGAKLTLPQQDYSLRWYDPRNGRMQTTPAKTIHGGRAIPFGNPPQGPQKDWVVLLTRK